MGRWSLIAHRATKLQPALLALEDSTIVEKEHLQTVLQNDSTKVESPAQPSGNGLGSDPLIDEYRQAKRRAMARTLCEYATTPAAWLIADRLAVSWGFSCAALGVSKPVDVEGERRRAAQLLRNAQIAAHPDKT